MFNLLPDNLKDKIKSEYRLRFWTVVLLLIIFLEVVLLVFIFPSWLTSFNKENDLISEVNKVNKSQLKNDTDPIIAEIRDLNLKLNIINTTLQYREVLPLAGTIISKKPRAIRITGFDYAGTGTSTADVVVRGISATREDLVSFVKTLKDTKTFKDAVLPVSNLAKDKNISFSINLTVAPQ